MKREAITHTKMKRLCRRFDIPLWQGVGLLETLWHLTARETPRGNIGKLSDEDIALALDYRGDESKLIDALVETGWLDHHPTHRLIVHDWSEHADDAVHMRLARMRQFFADGRSPKITRLAGEERRSAQAFFTPIAHKGDLSAQNCSPSAPPEPRQNPAPPEPRQCRNQSPALPEPCPARAVTRAHTSVKPPAESVERLKKQPAETKKTAHVRKEAKTKNSRRSTNHVSDQARSDWPRGGWDTLEDFDTWWDGIVRGHPNKNRNGEARNKAIELVAQGGLGRVEFEKGYAALRAAKWETWGKKGGRYTENLLSILADSLWKHALNAVEIEEHRREKEFNEVAF